MKQWAAVVGLGWACLWAGGCANAPATASSKTAGSSAAGKSAVEESNSAQEAAAVAKPTDRVLARIGNRAITSGDLEPLLLEAHGLDILLNVVQYRLAQQTCEQQAISVTPEDIRIERERTMDKLFADLEQKTRQQIADATAEGKTQKADDLRQEMIKAREPLLDQFLQQQYAQTHNFMSRDEFELLLTTNAYLRKLAEALPAVKAEIPEQALRDDFSVQYGEKAVVRHIQLANTQEVLEAQRRLNKGEPFAQVAAAMSRNRQTGPIGGSLPPFTRTAPEFPDQFKDVAFSLKPGEVSDAVQAGESYHLIKLESKISPKAVKFEDVRETLRADRHERIVQAAVNDIRQKLGVQARDQLRIEDPILSRKFNERLEAQKGKLRERDAIRKQMDREREAATQPSDEENSAPTVTTRPAVPALARPTTAPAAATRPARATP